MELMDPALHFLELSPTARPLLGSCTKWSFRALSRVSPGDPLEGFPESLREHFWEVPGDIRKAFFRVRAPFWSCVREQMQPKLGLDHEPKLGTSDLNVNSDPDSNLTNRTPRQFEVSSPSSTSDSSAPKLDLGLQA